MNKSLSQAFFNSDIAGIEDKNAREKALTETVIRIKKYHLEELTDIPRIWANCRKLSG